MLRRSSLRVGVPCWGLTGCDYTGDQPYVRTPRQQETKIKTCLYVIIGMWACHRQIETLDACATTLPSSCASIRAGHP